MTVQDETTAQVLQSVWMVGHDHSELDEDCSPAKPCRNMRQVTFDGYGGSDEDTAAAWKAKLEREGKLSEEGGSIRDLILGTGN